MRVGWSLAALTLQLLAAPTHASGGAAWSHLSRSKLLQLRGGSKVDMVIVGCGVPKRGMGWYHSTQLLKGEIPDGRLSAVVEPYFLGAGKDTPPGQQFAEYKKEVEAGGTGVKFFSELGDWVPESKHTCALIAGRTADNPRIFKELIDKGCTHIYLEKPGAPTVAELAEMMAYAEQKGVKVYVGYNKNVTKYVRLAREFEAKTPGAATTFIHNNAYTEEELPECFERNAEGILKNMAIHELALLVTYYGVKVDTVKEVLPDMEYSRRLTLNGPSSGKPFTDFSRVGFTVTTKAGKSVTVKADRCGDPGGSGGSIATVSVDGVEQFRSITPDDELKGVMESGMKNDPAMMPYFFLQDEDYKILKDRVCAHIATDADGTPEGIATIEIALEALKLAEYLNDFFDKAFA
mmetsp:Transcript_12972/g.33790  ORF Transcript_12972/g.33790 Transcript_12972/m.33790 type:complete len:406 (-) Transcript_12972:264-1481(-)